MQVRSASQNIVDIIVYQLDNTGRFEAIGEINKFTSLIWPDKYNGYTTFQLWAPINEENKRLIRKGNILWVGGDNAAVIEIIQSKNDEDGQKTFEVKGRTLEVLLTTRIVWNTYSCTNKYASTALYDIVNANCVNPTDTKRKIPFLVCDTDKKFGNKITYQKTGGEVYDAVEGICSDNNLGFDILFKPKEKALVFSVTCGVDRTGADPKYPKIQLSTDLQDVLGSKYYTNSQSYKNVALITGEDSGVNRKKTTSGDNSLSGFDRRELYVDARDIQSEVQSESGETSTIPEDEYIGMLGNRGDEKLADCQITETFEASIRTQGVTQYEYGIDYFRGDKIIVEDAELGVQAVAIIDSIIENINDEYELVLTLGYEYPSLIQRVKKQFM